MLGIPAAGSLLSCTAFWPSISSAPVRRPDKGSARGAEEQESSMRHASVQLNLLGTWLGLKVLEPLDSLWTLDVNG